MTGTSVAVLDDRPVRALWKRRSFSLLASRHCIASHPSASAPAGRTHTRHVRGASSPSCSAFSGSSRCRVQSSYFSRCAHSTPDRLWGSGRFVLGAYWTGRRLRHVGSSAKHEAGLASLYSLVSSPPKASWSPFVNVNNARYPTSSQFLAYTETRLPLRSTSSVVNQPAQAIYQERSCQFLRPPWLADNGPTKRSRTARQVCRGRITGVNHPPSNIESHRYVCQATLVSARPVASLVVPPPQLQDHSPV